MTEPVRSLRVAFVPGVMPEKWLRRWRDRHPGIPLTAFQSDAETQVRVLHDASADFSFVRLPVDREGLSVIPLYREQPVVVAAKGHEITVFDDVPLGELAGENVLRDPDRPVEELLDLAAAGAGVLILPMSVARHHHRRDVVFRPVSGVPESEVGLAWLTERTDDVIEEFIGIVRGRTERSSRQPSARSTDTASPARKTRVVNPQAPARKKAHSRRKR